MKVLSVYPIARGISKERLSYFSAEDVAPGSIVEVPLRSRNVPAVVVSSDDAGSRKAEIKSSDFSLRKISKSAKKSLFSPAFVKAAEGTADYFAAAPGAVLSSLIPKAVLDNILRMKEPLASEATGVPEKLALQAGDDERFSHYKSLIREEFARKRSVFFVLPTIEDVKGAAAGLEKGIEEYSFALHSKLRPKQLLELWNAIIENPHPVLIIGTAQFLSLCRADLKTIIVEKESSRNYRTVSRPFIDLRVFAEKFAKESGARFVVGDILLRTETIYAAQNDDYAELSPMKFRSLSSAGVSLVDMRSEGDEENKRFRIISDELMETIATTKENNEHLFLFGARKGYGTSTVCADCGEIVRCTTCGSPMTVYMLNVEESYFFCNKCGERRDAKERCAVCESWNLTMLGIGIERIEEEVKRLFPNVTVFRLDKESVTTEKEARAILEKFRDTPGSVLLGTELALIYLKDPLENAAVVSIDTLFAVPDFRINEKLFHTLLRIRNLAERRFIIQTRQPKEKVFGYAAQGNLMDFYRSEIAARKQFQYPPWSVFIKISLEGERAQVESEMRKIKKFLEPQEADLLAPPNGQSAKKFTMHALIKLKAEEWPNPALLQKLRALPPSFRIRVDPDMLI